MDALPAPAAEALQAAAAAVQPSTDKLWAYASSDPKAGAAATGLVVGLPLLALWRARLGGYSGQLQPAKAFELLNRSDTLLIDIRYAAQLWSLSAVTLFETVASTSTGLQMASRAVVHIYALTLLTCKHVREPLLFFLSVPSLVLHCFTHCALR